MIKRVLALGGISIGISMMVCSAPEAAAQQRATTPAPQRGGATAAPQRAGAKPWTPPKTPWGEPDLQGMWPLNHLISTPFQRPERFGTRRFLTEDEFVAAQKSAQDRNTRFESGAIP